MSDSKNEPISVTKWIALLGISVLGILLILTLGQPARTGATAPLPKPLTFDSPIGSPALTLDKTVDNAAPQPGDVISYTLAYANTVPGSQAFNVRLYDFLPAGVRFLSASPPPVSNQDGVLLFTAPSVGPGTTPTSITVRVRVIPGYESLYNQAIVTADNVTPTEDSLLVYTVPATDRLTLVKEGDTAALIGGDIVYTLRCENVGPVAFNNVEVIDVLPTGVTLSGTSKPPVLTALPLVKWPVGTLAPGQAWEVTITTTAPSIAGLITNTAILNAPTHDALHDLLGTTVISEGVILDVAKTGAAEVYPGEPLIYTLTYRNKGNQPASNIVLTNTLPAAVTAVGAAPPPSTTTGTQWIWGIANLAPGASGTIVITTTVNDDASGALYNFADITAPGAWADHTSLRTTVKLRGIFLPLVMKAYIP